MTISMNKIQYAAIRCAGASLTLCQPVLQGGQAVRMGVGHYNIEFPKVTFNFGEIVKVRKIVDDIIYIDALKEGTKNIKIQRQFLAPITDVDTIASLNLLYGGINEY